MLKAGGALVVGFSFLPTAHAQTQRGTAGPPDAQQIDSWITIHADNTATVFIGFAELGQGCSTALLQIAAEELDLGMNQVKTLGLIQTSLLIGRHVFQFSDAARRTSGAARGCRSAPGLLALASERLQLPLMIFK